MRFWLGFAFLLACVSGCDDEGDKPADMSVVVDASLDGSGGDLTRPPDFAECKFGTFPGLTEVDNVQTYACPCGCLVDGLQGSSINSVWAVVASANGLAMPVAGEGIDLSATSFGLVEFAGISSLNGIVPFFLDADFEISVDYTLTELSPDSRVRLITQTEGGPPTGTFLVERVRNLDGVDRYAGLTGEVAATAVETDAMEGTLTLRRVGGELSAIADGVVLGKLSGGSVARMHIIVTTGMKSCGVDAGSCSAKARIKNLRVANGTFINQR